MATLSRVARIASKKLLQKQCALCSVPVRWLNLQEYQSKKLMADNGVTVQRFKMASNTAEATEISQSFSVPEYVIKAQILAGGRGKGTFDNGYKGGVKLTKNPSDVADIVENMLGKKLTTKQTPPGGVLVNKVMVAEAFDIERETYFAILMDREFNGPVMVGSPMGGMDIEQVAEKNPEAIFKDGIDIMTGLTDKQAKQMATNLNFKGPQHAEAVSQIKKLYELFLKVDATQIEINPFVETPDGKVVCFDAKMNFDDYAKYRQKEIFAMDDVSESDPREVEAASHGLSYIGMTGNIGCLVNGAGLAMGTMDIIKLHKGEPANFMDCGGGVTEGQVLEAFKILTADSQVKCILVNVFGGIVNCATIANGIVNACRNINLTIPLVVRLEGTNRDEARTLLEESGMAIIAAEDFEDAAKKAVRALS